MERKIRVLYVHHHGTTGGASSSLRHLIGNFPEGSIESFILTPKGATVELFRSVSENVYGIPEPPEITSISGGKFQNIRLIKTFLNLGALREIREKIKQVNPDIIHLNEVSLGLVARLCKKMGYKVVMHARVVLSDEVPFLNKVVQFLARKYVDRIIAIDGSVAGKLSDAGKITVVYNPLHVDSSFSFKRNDNPDNTITCLFLANLITYKGIFDLLDAALQLTNQPNVRILIAGANSRPPEFFKTIKGKVLSAVGMVNDNESKVVRIIAENKLTNVKFLGHVKNINEWFQKTDVLLFPSHMNGPSRSIFEAGAMGIPSILALKDKKQDVVTHMENGLIISEKSSKQLADSIMVLASDASLRARLGENAKRHFNRLNDPKQSAASVLQVYKELLNE